MNKPMIVKWLKCIGWVLLGVVITIVLLVIGGHYLIDYINANIHIN